MRGFKDKAVPGPAASAERSRGTGTSLVTGSSVQASLANEIGLRIVRGD